MGENRIHYLFYNEKIEFLVKTCHDGLAPPKPHLIIQIRIQKINGLVPKLDASESPPKIESIGAPKLFPALTMREKQSCCSNCKREKEKRKNGNGEFEA